ncbi:MAG TPA: O-antigen ligase family protein [Alphaproteobacteria bacterium]|nr:O-antigen ligase family protein [Alphaproteobacteria bacterium]
MTSLNKAIGRVLDPRLLAWGAILIPLFVFVAPKISYWPLVFAGIVGLIRHAALRGLPPRSMYPLIGWTLALLVWIAISLAYAPDMKAGLTLLLKLGAYGACGLALVSVTLEHGAAMRRGAGYVHLVGGLAVAGALCVDYVSGGAVSTLLFGGSAQMGAANRNTTAIVYLALFAWLICVWLRGHGYTWVAAAPPMLAIVFAWLFGQFAAVLALLVGAVVFGLAMLRPRSTGSAVALLCAAFVIVAPVGGKLLAPGPWLRSAPVLIQFSAYHRMKIWAFAADRIVERPLLGWGIDASRRIPGGNTIVEIDRYMADPNQRYRTRAVIMPLHPHNAALQVWLELGVVGALLLAALCGGIPLACTRAPWSRTSIAAGLAMFSTAYVLAMLSFSLWQSRWHALLWLVGASAVVLLGDGPERKARDA